MDPLLLASGIAAAFVTVISSVGGTIILVVQAKALVQDRRDAATERRLILLKTAEAVGIVKTTAEKTTEIHVATNGHLHEMTASLKVANETIKGQLELIASLNTAKGIADEVAAKAAEHTTPSALAQTVKNGGAPLSSDAPVEVVVVNNPAEAVPTTLVKK